MLAACPSQTSFDRKCGRLCHRRTYSVACTTCKILQMNTEARKTLFQATISWSTPDLNYLSYICIFLVWASDVPACCTLTYELMSWAISAPYPQHIATGWPFGNLKARFSWFWVWGCLCVWAYQEPVLIGTYKSNYDRTKTLHFGLVNSSDHGHHQNMI